MKMRLTTTLLMLTMAAPTYAAPIVYPAQGQSPQQQSFDDGQCYSWAKRTTGVDPMAMGAPPPPPQQSDGGQERAHGMFRGALGGLAIGAIAGNAGEGAGIGAVLGLMAGGRQARMQQASMNQQAQGQAQYQQQSMATYNRAYSACMTGRGYTVT
jgi:hypothetical protein